MCEKYPHRSNPKTVETMVDEPYKEQEYYMDPNGVPMPRASLHEHQYTIEQLREMKQKYLMENVINCGYDPTEFAQFMEYKMGKSNRLV